MGWCRQACYPTPRDAEAWGQDTRRDAPHPEMLRFGKPGPRHQSLQNKLLHPRVVERFVSRVLPEGLCFSKASGWLGSTVCPDTTAFPPVPWHPSLHPAATSVMSSPLPPPFLISCYPLAGRDSGNIFSGIQVPSIMPGTLKNALKMLVLYFKKFEKIPRDIFQRL